MDCYAAVPTRERTLLKEHTPVPVWVAPFPYPPTSTPGRRAPCASFLLRHSASQRESTFQVTCPRAELIEYFCRENTTAHRAGFAPLRHTARLCHHSHY